MGVKTVLSWATSGQTQREKAVKRKREGDSLLLPPRVRSWSTSASLRSVSADDMEIIPCFNLTAPAFRAPPPSVVVVDSARRTRQKPNTPCDLIFWRENAEILVTRQMKHWLYAQ